MAISIDEVIAQEAKKDAYRKEYNQQPKVVERRKLYNTLRQEESKVARKVINKEMTMEEGETMIARLRFQYDEDLKKLSYTGTQTTDTQTIEDINIEPDVTALPKTRNLKSKKTS